MPTQPTVSCTLLTRNRRRFTSQAIWYFLRQDYPQRELILVDDGEEPIADLVPRDPRIRYVRPPGRLPAGARRNLACELSAGELIAHWDDDAWYSPQRLSAQVAHIQQSGAQAAGLSGQLYYQPLTGRVWRHEAPPGSPGGLHGGALIYRRSLWAARPFGEGPADDAAALVRAIPRGQLEVRPGAALMVALLHGSSPGPVNPLDPQWRPRSFDELGRLLGLDLGFYAGLRADGRAAARRPAPARLTLAATFVVYDGYGSMAEYLALGMARAGADVQIMPLRIDPAGLSPEFRELWRRSRPDPEGAVLCHAWWGENLARFGSARDLFIKTVWETSRLPADWPARLNQATAVIVPSRFAARVFRESGVRAPVEVAHEGIDPAVYPCCERPERRGLTTLVVGVLASRKNVREAVAAWKLAFAGDPDARLILKARFQLEPFAPDDPRISVVDRNEQTRGILHWYRQADVLMALGNEGFGLPLIEGMATGLPVVALDAEAQGDVCEEAAGRLLPVRPARWEPVDAPPFGPCGVRAIPDVEDAARQLRWVAEHREQARELGRRASAWAHERRNVWELGPATLAAIERHARSPLPLRRTYGLWATASGPGELGLYCADLCRALPLARLFAEPPPIWRCQSLHIQHAPGATDDLALARQIQAAQHNGAAVVVTEHGLGEGAAAWEQCADVLVALSAAAAARLRQRWPGKRVELIPPGCPAWRPATRDGAGAVIAAVGGLEAGWGGTLLAALGRIRGARLIVFGPPAGAAWAGAAQGLPVQLAALPATGDELAARLNAAADVVVVAGGGEGYAARVALASGVPVLVAPGGDGAELGAGALRPDDLEAGVREVLASAGLRAELARAARAFCDEASWPRVSAVHHALWRTLSA